MSDSCVSLDKPRLKAITVSGRLFKTETGKHRRESPNELSIVCVSSPNLSCPPQIRLADRGVQSYPRRASVGAGL
ncbi:hypothetical protein AAFF_G00191160, partial [Aldrovandia affinis]